MEKDFCRILSIEASAGSGKTYNLAKRFIDLLSHHIKRQGTQLLTPEHLGSIIALTFTNKAALEMKERIIYFLKILGGVYSKDNFKKEDFNIESKHSLEILFNLIKNHSEFNVTTIDSFINKIGRALSMDIGVSPDYNITFDVDEIFDLAFSEIISDVNLLKDITSFITSYLLLDKVRGINAEILLKQAIYTYKDKIQDIKLIDKLDILTYEDFLTNNKAVLQQLIGLKDQNSLYNFYNVKNQIRNKFLNYALIIRELLEFPKQDIFDQRKISYLKNLTLNLSVKHFTEITKLLEDNSISNLLKQKYKKDINTIQSIETKFLNCLLHIHNLYHLYNIIQNLHEVESIYEIINQFLSKEEEIKQLLNIVDGKTLNSSISRVIKNMENTGISYAFCKLGDNIYHYLIDEFQDTSKEQFEIVNCLIENTIASYGSLFLVGDKKQAIYGWRGGDYTIFDFVYQQYPFSKKALTKNYRSAKNIIKFNNKIFSNINKILTNPNIFNCIKNDIADKVITDISNIYQDAKQDIFKNELGYVEVKIKYQFSNKKEDIDRFYRKNTIECIKYLLNTVNINPSDIMILIRRKNDITKIINWIREDLPNVNFITEDSLMLINNPEIKKFLTLALAIIYPEDKSYEKAIKELGVNVDLNFLRIKCIGLSPYEFFSYLIFNYQDDFHYLDNEVFFSTLLDKVLELSSEKKTIEYIIDYFYKKDIFIDFPESIDAIKIMTIHKAKGLEAHSVIIPFYDWKLYNNIIHKYYLCKIDNIPYLQVKGLDKPILVNIGNKYIRQISKQAKAIYDNELKSQFIEALNLMYVANTRAINNLFIYGSVVKNKTSSYNKRNFNVAVILNEALKEIAREEDNILYYNIGEITHETNRNINTSNKDIDLNKSKKYSYSLISKHLKFTFKRFDDYLDISKQDIGELYHLAMSFIKRVDKLEDSKIEDLVNRVYNNAKLITKTDYEIVKKYIKNTIYDLSDYFLDIDEFWNEKEIIDQTGNIIRIDRLVKKNGKFYIIEYKTGEFSLKHIEQVQGYLAVFKEAKALIYYVKTRKIIKSDEFNNIKD